MNIEQAIEKAIFSAYGVSASDMCNTRKQSHGIVLARHMAAYVGHVEFGLTQRRAGEVAGMRRQSVARAIALIEDTRDDTGDDWEREVDAEVLEIAAIAKRLV